MLEKVVTHVLDASEHSICAEKIKEYKHEIVAISEKKTSLIFEILSNVGGNHARSISSALSAMFRLVEGLTLVLH